MWRSTAHLTFLFLFFGCQFHGQVPKDYLESADPRVAAMLRFEEVVDSVAPYSAQDEQYGADTLQDASGGSFSNSSDKA